MLGSPQGHEIWAEIKSRTLQGLSHPGGPMRVVFMPTCCKMSCWGEKDGTWYLMLVEGRCDWRCPWGRPCDGCKCPHQGRPPTLGTRQLPQRWPCDRDRQVPGSWKWALYLLPSSACGMRPRQGGCLCQPGRHKDEPHGHPDACRLARSLCGQS